MFTQTFSPPASSSPTSHAPGVTRRNSRLRGLSFLRNYTSTHLHSRDPNPNPASTTAQPPRTSRAYNHARSRSASFSSPTADSAATTAASPANYDGHPTSTANGNPESAPTRSRSTRLPRSNRFSAIGIPGFSATSSQGPTTSSSDPNSPSTTTAATSTPNSETPTARRGLARNLSVRSNRLSAITIPGFSTFSSSPAPFGNNRSDSPPPAPAAAVDLPQPPVPEANAIDIAAAPATHTTPLAGRTSPSPQPTSSTHDAEDPAMLPGGENATAMPSQTLPSIRFSTYYDARAARPSLTFQPVSRTLPSGSEVIKVGRYSERDAQPQVSPNVPSSAPVGFKSKVVSRRHCEFWFEGGKWHIRDVKSSSGTFLNHIRLSPPGTESRPYVVNDGDIIQLGIDFKGGEEMIFRCVKMRLELNRGWQNKLNTFNMSTHKKLRSLVANSSNGSTQDCSICLNSVAPCQSLFVAPCSHTWHYKCIRSLLNSPQYPIFVCPNCRAAADLEAEVDEPCEDWQQMTSEESEANSEANNETPPSAAAPSAAQENTPTSDSGDVADMTMRVEMGTPSPPPAQPLVPERIQHTMSDPVPIPPVVSAASHPGCAPPNPSGAGAIAGGSENPITPRNNVGPWVFDGSAGAGGVNGMPLSPGLPEMRSLDSAALDTASRP